MTSQHVRTRAFVYNQDQTAADNLALLFWEDGYDCWPFSRLDVFASCLGGHSPGVAVLDLLSEREAVQVSVLIAALCPECHLLAFVHNDAWHVPLQTSHKLSNLHLYPSSRTAEEILGLAHVVQRQSV